MYYIFMISIFNEQFFSMINKIHVFIKWMDNQRTGILYNYLTLLYFVQDLVCITLLILEGLINNNIWKIILNEAWFIPTSGDYYGLKLKSSIYLFIITVTFWGIFG